ncbi:MAG TPA: hypothetical protein VML19_35735 [Verrucomicrobiae bacterium]|nr:hypothetical protein [Verrucomicrobiae bacterium]
MGELLKLLLQHLEIALMAIVVPKGFEDLERTPAEKALLREIDCSIYNAGLISANGAIPNLHNLFLAHDTS